jgi:glycosyltransferase involved in cell wall biosynthesis
VPRGEMRAALGVPLDAPVAGVIARLTEQKGHRFLFDALATTPALARTHLIVVGGGELDDDLHHRAEGLGLTPRIHFLGPRRDLGNLLGAMDAFVLPSLWEGLPLSLVLAMGAGVPPVATDVAGIPEVVEDSRTGLLVPAGDASALGAALGRILSDAELRARVGRDAQASVLPRFGVGRYVDSIVNLYDRLLGQAA